MIAFSKGAFGGGAASLGVPMPSFFIDPIGATIAVAPRCAAMAVMLAAVIPFGSRLGIRMHHRLSQDTIPLLTNGLPVLAGLRLLCGGLRALLG